VRCCQRTCCLPCCTDCLLLHLVSTEDQEKVFDDSRLNSLHIICLCCTSILGIVSSYWNVIQVLVSHMSLHMCRVQNSLHPCKTTTYKPCADVSCCVKQTHIAGLSTYMQSTLCRVVCTMPQVMTHFNQISALSAETNKSARVQSAELD